MFRPLVIVAAIGFTLAGCSPSTSVADAIAAVKASCHFVMDSATATALLAKFKIDEITSQVCGFVNTPSLALRSATDPSAEHEIGVIDGVHIIGHVEK